MMLNKYVVLVVKFFVLFEVCICIRVVLDDLCFSVEDLGVLISVDLFLIVKVLRFVNSVLFCFFLQVELIFKVISVIGGEVLYNLVVVEIVNFVFKFFNIFYIDLDKYWY